MVTLFAFALLGFGQSPPGQAVARTLGVANTAKYYTVFAFTNVKALPYSARQSARQAIPVSITNHERSSHVFTVTAEQTSAKAHRLKVRVIVPRGETRQVNLLVPINCPDAAHASTTQLDFALHPSAKSLTHFVKCEPT